MLACPLVPTLSETTTSVTECADPETERTASARRPGRMGHRAFALLAVVIATLALLELLPGQRPPVAAATTIAHPAAGAMAPLHVSLPLGTLPSGPLFLAAGMGRSGPLSVLVVADHGGQLVALPEALAGSRRSSSAVPTVIFVGAAPAGSILGVSTGSWHGVDALFVISRSGGRISDEALALDGSARVLAHGTVLTGSGAGAVGYASVNIGPGAPVSVFLLSRTGDQLSISVRPGFPSPGSPDVSIAGRLPFAGAAASIPVIAAVDSQAGDVALLNPAAGGAQMHVIPEDVGYKSFGTQVAVPVSLPSSAASIAIAHDDGAPVLVVLDVHARRLTAYGLWAGTPIG